MERPSWERPSWLEGVEEFIFEDADHVSGSTGYMGEDDIGAMLRMNSHKPFVNPDGSHSTHLMASLKDIADWYTGNNEALLSILSGAVAEPVAGFVGLASMPFTGSNAGSVVDRVRDNLTYQPRSQAGQQRMQGIGETLAPVGEFLEKPAQYLGDKTMDLTGSPGLAAIAYTSPFAALELLGLKGANQLGKAGKLGTQYEIGDIANLNQGPLRRQTGAVSGADLPSDHKSLVARADDDYHATNRDIESFGGNTANPEGDFDAKNIKMSDDVMNAEENPIDIYSGTTGEKATEITPYGEFRGAGQNNLFGGIFGSEDINVAESHGDIQRLKSSRHISDGDMRSLALYDDATAPIARQHLKDILKEHKGAIPSSDELDELMDYVTGDRSLWKDDPDMGSDRYSELTFGRIDDLTDLAEADWDLQGIKGELARRLGYTSVGMVDEHGESVLALSGALFAD